MLIIDTCATIPSIAKVTKYTAVYRSSKKYRETANITSVESTIIYSSYIPSATQLVIRQETRTALRKISYVKSKIKRFFSKYMRYILKSLS